MGFLTNKLIYAALGLIAILGTSCFSLWTENHGLNSVNKILKEDKKKLEDEKRELEDKNSNLKGNLNSCDAALLSQNKQIEAMRVEVEPLNSEAVKKIEKIYVKDKSCEGELKAYKELFHE